jgi:hypothetical protein
VVVVVVVVVVVETNIEIMVRVVQQGGATGQGALLKTKRPANRIGPTRILAYSAVSII